MNHSDVGTLRDDDKVIKGFFAKASDAETAAEFAAAVSKRYWTWLRHYKPGSKPLKEETEKEIADLIERVTHTKRLRYNPSSKRYVQAGDSSGSFEAYVAYSRDIIKKSKEEEENAETQEKAEEEA